MNMSIVRQRSKTISEKLGYQFNPNLPLLDIVHNLRAPESITGRILCLFACVCCSYGFSKESSLRWLEQEGVSKHLSGIEHKYLKTTSISSDAEFQWQVEALWALAWAAGYHDQLNFLEPCSDDFIKIFPDIKLFEKSHAFRTKCKIRSMESITEVADLVYCLHWSVREEALSKKRNRRSHLQSQVIVERRHALEWLICDEGWDEISMDT